MTRGDPSRRCGGRRSRPRHLAEELTAAGHRVGPRTVAKLLTEAGYSLQANAKTHRGQAHILIGTRSSATSTIRCEEYLRRGDPVISVDTKKKELVGQLQERWGRSGNRPASPSGSTSTTSPTKTWARPCPYGVYDLAAEHRLGQRGHDARHRRVRRRRRSAAGGKRSAGPPTRTPKRLLITADCGGSNGYQGPTVENRARRLGRRDRPGHHGLPLAAGHQQVEQDRTPAVQPHHHELARPTADQPTRSSSNIIAATNPYRPEGPARNWTRRTTRKASGSATNRWRHHRCTDTTSTATGTTRCDPNNVHEIYALIHSGNLPVGFHYGK